MRLDLRPEERRSGCGCSLSRRVGVSIAALVFVTGILACVVMHVHGTKVRASKSNLQAEIEATHREIVRSETLLGEHAELWKRVERARVSRSVVPASGVLAAIAEATEGSFTLSRLTLTVRSSTGDGTFRSVVIEVEGSTDDTKGATAFLDRLSSHPGMSDVRLVSVQEQTGPSGPWQRCVLVAAVRPRQVELTRHGGG